MLKKQNFIEILQYLLTKANIANFAHLSLRQYRRPIRSTI